LLAVGPSRTIYAGSLPTWPAKKLKKSSGLPSAYWLYWYLSRNKKSSSPCKVLNSSEFIKSRVHACHLADCIIEVLLVPVTHTRILFSSQLIKLYFVKWYRYEIPVLMQCTSDSGLLHMLWIRCQELASTYLQNVQLIFVPVLFLINYVL
jgi:hypothetical protein